MTIAWLLVIPCLVILFGAIVPVVPWLRIYAVSMVPNHSPWGWPSARSPASLSGMLAHIRRRTLGQPSRWSGWAGVGHRRGGRWSCCTSCSRWGIATVYGPIRSRRCRLRELRRGRRARTRAASMPAPTACRCRSTSPPGGRRAGHAQPGDGRGPWRRLLRGQPRASARQYALVCRSRLDRDQHRLSPRRSQPANLGPWRRTTCVARWPGRRRTRRN